MCLTVSQLRPVFTPSRPCFTVNTSDLPVSTGGAFRIYLKRPQFEHDGLAFGLPNLISESVLCLKRPIESIHDLNRNIGAHP